jgi:hypothetical protein
VTAPLTPRDAGAVRRSVRRLLAATLLTAAVAGCGAPAVPDRAPDVTGVVRVADGGPVLADPSDSYFEGMSLVRGDPVVVHGDESGETTPADLRDGDAVEVWIEDGCAESFPVQCTVVALRVPG